MTAEELNEPAAGREQCWILLGERRGALCLAKRVNLSVGSSTQVEFNAAWVIRREEDEGDIVGFLHTHPSGALEPSQRDVDTMRAWASCLGKPLLCLIAGSNAEARAYDRGSLQGYRFDDDASLALPIVSCELFADEWVVVYDPIAATDD